MTISFNYKSVKRPNGTTVKTPSIPIILCGKMPFETIGLIDSGADVSAMPKELAELLELDLSAPNDTSFGIGGKVDSIPTKVKIIVEKGHEKYSFLIPIKVIIGTYDFPVLLGRSGFFNQFVVTFDQSNQKVHLKSSSKKRF
jgi:hypothetical protein